MTEKDVGTLIKVKAWDVIKMLIERKEVESLRKNPADKIFCKLRDPQEEGGIKISTQHLKETLNFSIGDMCRLRVPMEKVTPYIEWKHIKQQVPRNFNNLLGSLLSLLTSNESIISANGNFSTISLKCLGYYEARAEAEQEICREERCREKQCT